MSEELSVCPFCGKPLKLILKDNAQWLPPTRAKRARDIMLSSAEDLSNKLRDELPTVQRGEKK